MDALRLELSQVDSQRVDQRMTDLQEIFLNRVELERGLEACNEKIAQLQSPSGPHISTEAYKARARGTEQALEHWSNVDLSWGHKRRRSKMEKVICAVCKEE